MSFEWISEKFPAVDDVRPLAQGGQKVVFSAHHSADGDVVLKFLLNGPEDERAEREVLAAEIIDFDRVPTIYDKGTVESPLGTSFWLREERVAGQSLREVLADGPLEISRVLKIGVQVLEALAAAEEKRIVHRDVKPGNLLIDANDCPWLLDFGLARHLDLQSITATAQPFGVGTLGYSAPEQMRNKKSKITCRADLFALGISLYECLTGSNPFREGARDELEILERTETMPLPSLKQHGIEKPILDDFLSAMTQKYPDQRPLSVKDALSWLREIYLE